MSVVIYWCSNDKSWLRATAPELVYKNFVKNTKNQKNNLILCPAIKDYMENIFLLKSLFTYDFTIDSHKSPSVFTNTYNQPFFDNHVDVRSEEDRLFSFLQRFCFFTEEKSLLMSAGIFPFLENNNITKRCNTIPGTFNIGKWFRQIEFAFYLKEEFNEFKIEEGEIFQYIQFHTKEKIIFKQFRVNEKIQSYFNEIDNAKEDRKLKLRSLESYYLMMKHKKNIINEVKNNLVD